MDGRLTAMLTTTDRILTTHAGSLPRPPALAELHGRRSRGEDVDAAELRDAVEAAPPRPSPARSKPASTSATTVSRPGRASSRTSSTG
jgi:5-methyltetrahydropteroyltriglutamate--homocysteine methyltransferase